MLTICKSKAKEGELKTRATIENGLTFGASDALDLLGVGADIVDDGALEVRDLEVPAFAHDVLLYARELVELEGAMTRLHWFHPNTHIAALGNVDKARARSPAPLLHRANSGEEEKQWRRP
jgi:hypothetical protein